MKNTVRLLFIEDDALIRESVSRGLQQDGLTVNTVADGTSGLLVLKNDPYDLLLLDLGLPRIDGITVLGTLRQQGNKIPVLILPARDTVADCVRGLNAGADDYLVKPFDLLKLAARIHALLRRQAGRAGGTIGA